MADLLFKQKFVIHNHKYSVQAEHV